MARVQKLRDFVSQRLNAAVDEILAAFEKMVVKYEEEAALCQEVISRQHALLCALNKPLMEVPSADGFTQQLMFGKEEVRPEQQDQDQDQDRQDPQPSHVREELEGEQFQDLDEADIIEFTYNPRRAVRPGEAMDLSPAGTAQVELGLADPDQDVSLVLSSETEDSDDYSKDCADPRPASNRLKPKTSRRPGLFSCRVCSRTYKARRFLFRHIKAHLQEAEQVCGLCGERFETTDSLRLHIQAHLTTRRKRDPENQTRERRFRQHPNLNANNKGHEDQKPNKCDDCGKTFLQVWKKKKHRCCSQRKSQDPESLEGTKRKKRT